MSTGLKLFTLAAWLLSSTFFYCYLWTGYPQYFPTYPNWVATTLNHLYGLNGKDNQEDFMYALLTTLSFLNVLALTLLGWLVFRFGRWCLTQLGRRT
jgi:hypothetical protein